VLALVRSRNLRGSSFAFTVAQRGGERFTTDETGKAIREVVEASGLFEMGPVVTPAYSSTSIAVAMRSYEAWLQQSSEPAAQADSVRSTLRGVAAAWAAILRLRNV
jgi:phage head maturation protease